MTSSPHGSYRSLGLVVTATLAAGCHVVQRTELRRPEAERLIPHTEGAVARKPALQLTEAGALRFVEPLECPSEREVASTTTVEVETRPNLATFVVGVLATAVGGVMMVGGLGNADSASNPLTYAGIGGVVAGLPLAIGPFAGTGTRLETHARDQAAPRRIPGPSVPCGARPLAASSATLTVQGIELHGAIDADGTFEVSAFQLVDAFAPAAVNGWAVTAAVETATGPRTVTAVLEGTQLAKVAPAFLAHADFDPKIEPMRLVPGLVPGALRASLTSTRTGPALRVVLPIKNEGPGPAWALRGQLTSSTRAVDGRILYIGHLGKGEAVTRELLIPLTAAAADQLRGATLELSIELRDAHGTAPATPIRFRGAVLGDAPR